MDFDLSDEQRLLKDSVDRLIADHYGFEDRGRMAKEPRGWSGAMWARYAELGLLGLPFDERHGGFGGGPVELAVVMEAIGRGLALEPYFATVVLGGGLLRHGASEAQKAALIPRVAEGRLKLAFAQMERESRYDLADITTVARRVGEGWALDGAKSLVLHGDVADTLIVSARVAGQRRDRAGVGVFLVDAKSPGVSRRGYPMQDGLRAAEIIFDGAAAEVLGDPQAGLTVIERAVDEAIAALCAEAMGAMVAAQELTVDYLKTRKQFGRAIGEFQALQHRAVDMYVLVEQARSMTMFATMMADDADPTARRSAISAAKAQVGRAGRKLAQEAVQLHGGIGMTMEYKVGHYFKRLTAIDMMFGDADTHLAEVARLGGLVGGTREVA